MRTLKKEFIFPFISVDFPYGGKVWIFRSFQKQFQIASHTKFHSE